VDFLRVTGELIGLAGHPVVEARADADEQIRLGHRVVGVLKPVHPEHPEAERVAFRKPAQSQQARRHGDARRPRQLSQLLGGAGMDHPRAGVDHRPLGVRDYLRGSVDRLLLQFRDGLRAVAADARLLGVDELRFIDRRVHRQVDDHRPRAARPGDIKRLLDDPGYVPGVLHQVAVLRDRPRDADGIGFLERVIADHRGADLTGQRDDGDRIHERGRNAGHEVRGPGT